MSGFYPYIIASLPALSFGMKAPFTYERFLGMATGFVSDDELGLIRSLPGMIPGSCSGRGNETVRQWLGFETMVHNEFVMIRAQRRKLDPARYIRTDGCPGSTHAAHIAINAYRKTSPLESERALDIERWRWLDELSLGHYFDIDALVIYGLRLAILEKWDRIRAADGAKLVEAALVHTEERTKERKS